MIHSTHVDLTDPGLCGTQEEQPCVLKAIATQIPDERGNPIYHLACFIRHWDVGRRLAVVKSNQSRAHAAQCMDDNLSASSILWDGSFEWGTPEQLGLGAPSADPEEVKRLITDN